jgi:hypothetical protein
VNNSNLTNKDKNNVVETDVVIFSFDEELVDNEVSNQQSPNDSNSSSLESQKKMRSKLLGVSE